MIASGVKMLVAKSQFYPLFMDCDHVNRVDAVLNDKAAVIGKGPSVKLI